MTQIGILDFGSQHLPQIARTFRDLGFWSDIVKPSQFDAADAIHHYPAVVGSGSFRSVYDKDAPVLPASLLSMRKGRAFLGICYSMQSLVHQLGGEVVPGVPEFSKATVTFGHSELFEDLLNPMTVWMSHSDRVVTLPDHFTAIAHSDGAVIAAIEHDQLPFFGVQFHPEVSHTLGGAKLLRTFARIAGIKPDYEPVELADRIQDEIRMRVGPGENALLLYSGGIDSTVTAINAKQAIGDRLHCVTFSGGQLREGEIDEIQRNAKLAGISLEVIECSVEMIAAVGSTLDPEQKRKIFSGIYSRLAREAAARCGAKSILQGTIAPDLIESGKTGGAVIKTHHNSHVDFGDLVKIEPIKSLFKDEVRRLANESGLSPELFAREPFPGPGNFIRVTGIPVTREALEVVQWAQARVKEVVYADPRYKDIAQLVVAVIGRSPAVKGDKGVFGYNIGVRAVRTKDWMTAEGVTWGEDIQAYLCNLLGKHPMIVNTGFFPTNKPPAPTEWE